MALAGEDLREQAIVEQAERSQGAQASNEISPAHAGKQLRRLDWRHDVPSREANERRSSRLARPLTRYGSRPVSVAVKATNAGVRGTGADYRELSARVVNTGDQR
jgi:hypothetical protein